MSTSKLDRRKKYTRMVLKDSLIHLLKEKQISSITVKEICVKADINRSTFYTHYHDQFDLLDKIEEELIEDMKGYLSQYNYEDDDLQMIERLLEYFSSKAEICKTLLNEKVDTTFQKKVMVVAQHFFMKNWQANSHIEEDLSEYLSIFVISGSIYVTKSWLNNDMDKSPREMAEMINSMIKNGLIGVQ